MIQNLSRRKFWWILCQNTLSLVQYTEYTKYLNFCCYITLVAFAEKVCICVNQIYKIVLFYRQFMEKRKLLMYKNCKSLSLEYFILNSISFICQIPTLSIFAKTLYLKAFNWLQWVIRPPLRQKMFQMKLKNTSKLYLHTC